MSEMCLHMTLYLKELDYYAHSLKYLHFDNFDIQYLCVVFLLNFNLSLLIWFCEFLQLKKPDTS